MYSPNMIEIAKILHKEGIMPHADLAKKITRLSATSGAKMCIVNGLTRGDLIMIGDCVGLSDDLLDFVEEDQKRKEALNVATHRQPISDRQLNVVGFYKTAYEKIRHVNFKNAGSSEFVAEVE